VAQESIHLFVFDTLSDWEYGYAVAGINNPAFQSRPCRYRIRTVAVQREPVMAAGGLRVLPDLTLDALDPSQSSMLLLSTDHSALSTVFPGRRRSS
jgi:hypothetical protein